MAGLGAALGGVGYATLGNNLGILLLWERSASSLPSPRRVLAVLGTSTLLRPLLREALDVDGIRTE